MTNDDMKDLLAPLRLAYIAEVRNIAEHLAPRFRAHEFDNYTATREHADEPWLALEMLIEQLPLCQDNAIARMVLAVSPYAAAAPLDEANIEALPPDRMWQAFAAWCLARDVHDEAIERGWAFSQQERECPDYEKMAAEPRS